MILDIFSGFAFSNVFYCLLCYSQRKKKWVESSRGIKQKKAKFQGERANVVFVSSKILQPLESSNESIAGNSYFIYVCRCFRLPSPDQLVQCGISNVCLHHHQDLTADAEIRVPGPGSRIPGIWDLSLGPNPPPSFTDNTENMCILIHAGSKPAFFTPVLTLFISRRQRYKTPRPVSGLIYRRGYTQR